MSVVVVVGATSGIGEAICHELAGKGFDLVLTGRDAQTIEGRAKDLEVRFGVRTWIRSFEALDYEAHETWVPECVQEVGEPLFGFIVCYAMMPDEADAASKGAIAREMIGVNYTSIVSFLDRAADYLESRKSGFLAAITSVAGDRGRGSNYHYGSTKAGLSAYLSGLRARMFSSGVNVTDLRPGMVDTKHTYGLPGLVLLASPATVARDAVRGILRNRAIVYTPRIWWAVMLVIRLLPDFVFKRLSF
jgi:short-subunit dehydrogenase